MPKKKKAGAGVSPAGSEPHVDKVEAELEGKLHVKEQKAHEADLIEQISKYRRSNADLQRDIEKLKADATLQFAEKDEVRFVQGSDDVSVIV